MSGRPSTTVCAFCDGQTDTDGRLRDARLPLEGKGSSPLPLFPPSEIFHSGLTPALPPSLLPFISFFATFRRKSEAAARESIEKE